MKIENTEIKTQAEAGTMRVAQRGIGCRHLEWYEDDTSEKDAWFKNGYVIFQPGIGEFAMVIISDTKPELDSNQIYHYLRRTPYGLSLPIMAFEHDFILSAISRTNAIFEHFEELAVIRTEHSGPDKPYRPNSPGHDLSIDFNEYYLNNGMSYRIYNDGYDNWHKVDFRYNFRNTLVLHDSNLYKPKSPKKYIQYVIDMLTLSDDDIYYKYPTRVFNNLLDGIEKGVSDKWILY